MNSDILPNPKASGVPHDRHGTLLRCIAGQCAKAALKIPDAGLLIGRNSRKCQVVLSSSDVSSVHIKVWPDLKSPGLWVQDMRSMNGTWLRNARIGEVAWSRLTEPRLLNIGAHVRVASGAAEFEVCTQEPQQPLEIIRRLPSTTVSSLRRHWIPALSATLGGLAFFAFVLAIILWGAPPEQTPEPATYRPVPLPSSVPVPVSAPVPSQARTPTWKPIPIKTLHSVTPAQAVEFVDVELSNLHADGSAVQTTPGDALVEGQSRFSQASIRLLGGKIHLKNNYFAVCDSSGTLGLKYVQPDGQTFQNGNSPRMFTLERSVSLAKETNFVDVIFGWGNAEYSAFEEGTWTIEFWWNDCKIGERQFFVYGVPGR
jgi:hypothetical protein